MPCLPSISSGAAYAGLPQQVSTSSDSTCGKWTNHLAIYNIMTQISKSNNISTWAKNIRINWNWKLNLKSLHLWIQPCHSHRRDRNEPRRKWCALQNILYAVKCSAGQCIQNSRTSVQMAKNLWLKISTMQIKWRRTNKTVNQAAIYKKFNNS